MSDRKFQGTLSVRVKHDVSVDQLQDLIAQIGGMTGCRPCGLLGIDLRLTGDPVEFGNIAKLPGVSSVNLG